LVFSIFIHKKTVKYLQHITGFYFPGEKELEKNSPIRDQLLTPDGKRPSIFLRYKEKDPDRGVIKVYPGGVR
jgi:hypothetical protein